MEVGVKLPKLDLTEQYFARPVLHLERNNNLFDGALPIESFTEEAFSVNSQFLYRTNKCSLPALTPNREYGNIVKITNEILQIGASGTNAGKVAERLRNSLGLDTNGVFTISIAASYAYDLIPGNPLSTVHLLLTGAPPKSPHCKTRRSISTSCSGCRKKIPLAALKRVHSYCI